MYPVHARRKTLLFASIFFIVLCVLCNMYYDKVNSHPCLQVFQTTQCDIQVSTHDLSLKLHEKGYFNITLTNVNTTNVTLHFVVNHADIVKIVPPSITLDPKIRIYEVTAEATSAGHTEVTATVTNTNINVDDVYLRVKVYKNHELDIVSTVIGWIYFAAWSVSFYPQIYINYRRKSVVGLHFDFLVLNFIGFTLYSIFNLGLYSIPGIEEEYFRRHPRGLNPVQVNDVFFSVHATVATVLTIIQCFLYERGDQRVSIIARGILGVFGTFLFISFVLTVTDVLHWLDLLNFCSYVKLAITLIKYVPQAYMNYKRKSTVGWSIGNILLDFTGGMLSMLQMILIAYNYNDWKSIFGDFTKFGLGLFSVAFDIFFIVQHYILYRHTSYEQN